MKVYLAGPINGCTDEECKGWRERAKQLLPNCEILDPMVRDYRGKENDSVIAIVEDDLKDIESSDLLLVNASKASWGTCMEIVHAFSIMAKTVVAFGVGEKPSPWLVYHSDLTCLTLEEACKYIQEYINAD
jgi:nucleoside 2-deoxyribosyltransferase